MATPEPKRYTLEEVLSSPTLISPEIKREIKKIEDFQHSSKLTTLKAILEVQEKILQNQQKIFEYIKEMRK